MQYAPDPSSLTHSATRCPHTAKNRLHKPGIRQNMSQRFGRTYRSDSASHIAASRHHIPQRFGLTHDDDRTKHTVTIGPHIPIPFGITYRDDSAKHTAAIRPHELQIFVYTKRGDLATHTATIRPIESYTRRQVLLSIDDNTCISNQIRCIVSHYIIDT